ncbi:hypothetical protein JCM3774_006089 [Rhodotorula dairenensis]
MSPRAETATLLPSSSSNAASSQPHPLQRHVLAAPPASVPRPYSILEHPDKADSVRPQSAAAVETRQGGSDRGGNGPACDHSDDERSVGTRSTPGPETPRHSSTVGDDVRRRSSASSTLSAPPTRRSDFSTGNIPPFRGGRLSESAHSGLSGKPYTIEEQGDKPRRSSGPSVFMIPAPAPISAPPGATPAQTTTGLGIEGLAEASATAAPGQRPRSAGRGSVDAGAGDSRGASLKRSLATGETNDKHREARRSGQREPSE